MYVRVVAFSYLSLEIVGFHQSERTISIMLVTVKYQREYLCKLFFIIRPFLVGSWINVICKCVFIRSIYWHMYHYSEKNVMLVAA